MNETDRRTVIADAAIGLLAAEGARGLTHRGVDRAVGLPDGSTSYYCRRRIDLLALAVRRYTELEHHQLLEYAKVFKRPMSLEETAETAATQMLKWLQTQNQPLLTARFELFLVASREPELQRIVEKQRQAFEQTIRDALTVAGVPKSDLAARALLALMEGILLDGLRTGSPVLNPSELKTTLRAILKG